MADSEIKVFRDLEFSVIARKSSYYVDFNIYEISGFSEDGAPLYNNEPIMFSKNIEDAAIFANGSVRWDGCSNWSIGEEGVMVHSCDKEHLLNIGKVLAACWDWASELLLGVWDAS